MPPFLDDGEGRRRLESAEQALRDRADEIAVYLVFDRPGLVEKRPGLARTNFVERCVPDAQLQQMRNAFVSVGAEAEVVGGDHDYFDTLLGDLREQEHRPLRVAYNGLSYNVGEGAFARGRKSLVPLVSDSFDVTCANSDAYVCAFTLHKYHSFILLESLGIRAPKTWHFRPDLGWVGGSPPPGIRVIAKSTYESWAVGVTDTSVFLVDDRYEERLAVIAEQIGQAVIVQEFIPGPEVYVPVFSCPEPVATPPVLSVLHRAPDDDEAFVRFEDNLSDDGISYRLYEGGSSIDAALRCAACEIFSLLEMEGVGRIDFRIDEEGQPWVFDIAISPGLEKNGAVGVSMREYGFDHAKCIRTIVASTLVTRGLL